MKYRNNAFWLFVQHSPLTKKVMYHVNPAVIKSILSRLPKDQFILQARFIRRQIPKAVPDSNRQAMFINLYQWCRVFYLQRFIK
jgi:hypothetical protein